MKKKKIGKILDKELLFVIEGACNGSEYFLSEYKTQAFEILRIAFKLKVINRRDYDTCWDIINMMKCGRLKNEEKENQKYT